MTDFLDEQILVQGLNIVRVIVELFVLTGLIISTFTTSWFFVNRRSSRMEVVLMGLKASVVLGTLAGCTAFIVDDWTLLLIFDVLFAVAQAIFFVVAAVIFPNINEEKIKNYSL